MSHEMIREYIDLTTNRVLPLMLGEIPFPRTEGDPVGTVPYNFKLYDQQPTFTLPHHLPIRQEVLHQSEEITTLRLATLLHYMYGVVQWEGFWPQSLHRTIPGARTLYPSELYIYLREAVGDLPAGVYHYDSLHHRAVLLRKGQYDSYIRYALQVQSNLPQFTLFVTTLYWKMAEKYKNFCFRLASTEAGLLTGNVAAVAEADGLQAEVYYQFVDHPLQQLLGLDEREETINSVVMLTTASNEVQVNVTSKEDVISSPPEIALLETKTNIVSGLQSSELIWLHRIRELSVLATVDEIRRVAPPSDSTFDLTVLNDFKLERWLTWINRNSAPLHFVPSLQALKFEDLLTILHRAVRPYKHDFWETEQPTNAPINAYVVVSRVEGLKPGVYRYYPSGTDLKLIYAGDLSTIMQRVYLQDNINAEQSPCVIFLTGNYKQALETWGNRGYRMLNMAAGFAAQQSCLVGSTLGIYVRSSLSFDVGLTTQLLKLPGEETPLFQCITGVAQGDMRYRKRVII